MPSGRDIDDFLAQKRIAFVGVSRNPKQFANTVYRSLKNKGYQVVPVNPHSDLLEGDRCYPELSKVPGPVEGALIMLPPAQAAGVVRQCAEAGIQRVWLGKGSESPEAVEIGRQHGMKVVDGACPMMFAEPVGFGHACHRFFVQITGGLPK